MPPKKPEDSAARRTRSQAAPDWTLTQSLILVNEIAAVEADCLDALSYYQKWKMIADNCAALDVNRTLDQCRRKWDSLFAHYNFIKRWEEEEEDSGGDSYWRLRREERRALGLPEEFDRYLFNAVDDVVKAQVERARDTVVDDADADPLGVIAPPVLKKQIHQLTPQKRQIEEETEKKLADITDTGPIEATVTQLVKKAASVEVTASQLGKKDKPLEIMEKQLREKAEMIQAILEGKLDENRDYTLNDLRQGPGSQISLARRQADNLIDCFRVIASTLDELCKAGQIQ